MTKKSTAIDHLSKMLEDKKARTQAQTQAQTQQKVKRQLQVTKDGAPVEGSEEAQNDARLRTGCYFPAAVALNGSTLTHDKLVATFHELQTGTGFAQKDLEDRLAVQITTLDFMFYDLLTRSHSAPNLDFSDWVVQGVRMVEQMTLDAWGRDLARQAIALGVILCQFGLPFP